jgi:hypothetical protein
MKVKSKVAILARATLIAAVLLTTGAHLAISGDSRIGPFHRPSVLCDPYGNQITFQGQAGSAPGVNGQWIFIKHYLYREGVGWILMDPPAQGWIQHTRQDQDVWIPGSPFGSVTAIGAASATGTSWTVTLASGSYAIYTEYYWRQADGTDVLASAWSGSVTYLYTHTAAQTPWCNLDISLLGLPQ